MARPKSTSAGTEGAELRIRMYRVGFGDFFLVSVGSGTRRGLGRSDVELFLRLRFDYICSSRHNIQDLFDNFLDNFLRCRLGSSDNFSVNNFDRGRFRC